MTRRIDNGSVVVTLENGSWTAEWPAARITAGPFEAQIELTGRTLESHGFGAWAIDAGDAFGRAGAWARWLPTRDGPTISVHLPSEGPVLVVEASYRARTDQRFGRIVPLLGSVTLASRARLVNGYDSWSWSGVRPAKGAAVSYWNTALVDTNDHVLAVQALDADRLCTRIESAGHALRVDCGATPPLEPVEGTWGHTVALPPDLGIPLPAGTEERSPPIAVTAGIDPIGVVDELAGLAGRQCHARPWRGAPINGWESWYHYGLLDVDPQVVLANAKALREWFPAPSPCNLVQVDDGWQVTYGSWVPNDRFPSDLRLIVRDLEALGCRTGLWLAPFMVQPNGPGIGTEHVDWCVRGPDGQPAVDRLGRWALDASNPAVVEELRRLGERVRGWEVAMVKLDFLYLGAIEGDRTDPRATGTESLRRGLEAFVEGIGPDVYVLGCGMPMLPGVGLCHGNRVGHDLAIPVRMRELGQPRPGWRAVDGIRPQARNVAARFALRRWYGCDPDVVMAWNDGTDPAGFSADETRSLATIAAMTGGPFLLADDLAALPAGSRAVLAHGALHELANGPGFLPMDLFAHGERPAVEQYFVDAESIPSVWRAERNGRSVLALFNWTDRVSTVNVPHSFAGATEVWAGSTAGARIEIPPHGVRVLVASP
ncbi:MAG: alpha-galactosidase [Acidimicrobiia bacterium]